MYFWAEVWLAGIASVERIHQAGLVGNVSAGGTHNFTNTTSHNAYRTEARIRRRNNPSRANKIRINTLDCHSIGQAKLKKSPPHRFKVSMIGFMVFLERDYFLVVFFRALMSASSLASSSASTSWFSSRHCTIGVSAPLKACFSA